MNINNLKNASVGERIRIARTEATNLTEPQFAMQIGVDQDEMMLWEMGEREPDQETLAKIAEVTGVTINFLMGDLPRLPSTYKPLLVIPIKDDTEKTAEMASRLFYDVTDDDMHLDIDLMEKCIQDGWCEFLSGALIEWVDGEGDDSATLDYMMYVRW